MSFYAHEAVIVYLEERTWGQERLEKFIAALPSDMRALFAGPIPSYVNAGVTFFMAPDGSKEGWPESNRCDAVRRAFIEEAKKCKHPRIMHVLVHDDDHRAAILFSSTLALCSYCGEHSALRPCPEMKQ